MRCAPLGGWDAFLYAHDPYAAEAMTLILFIAGTSFKSS